MARLSIGKTHADRGKMGNTMAQPVKLNFSAPRRGLPPKHFADLTETERIDKLAEIGLPKFRAKQLAKHYSEH